MKDKMKTGFQNTNRITTRKNSKSNYKENIYNEC